MTGQRKSSFELLRILAASGIILLHYNLLYAFNSVNISTNENYLILIESIFISSVNLFVMISGFFLSKTNARRSEKVFQLLVEVILTNIIFYIVTSLINKTNISTSWIIYLLLPRNYFVILYGVLYIVSPYINLLIEKLDKKQFKTLVCICIMLFSFYTIILDVASNNFTVSFNGLNTIGLYGDQNGYTIVNFILLYLVAAYISKYKVELEIRKCVILLILLVVCVFGWSLIEKKILSLNTVCWNYNNPFLIFIPALVVILFNKIDIYNKTINKLSKASFTCFLVHSYIIDYLEVEKYVNTQFLILHQIFSILIIYTISYLIYRAFDLIIKPLMKVMNPIFIRIDKILFTLR